MDERTGSIRLVDPGSEAGSSGLVATISRAEVERARSEEGPIDLLLDVDRATADGRETERIALGVERLDLERMLELDGNEIPLTFDEDELKRLLDEDVEAHGIRKALAIVTVVAGMAVAGASPAFASPVSDGALPGGAATPAATAQKSDDSSSWSTGATAAVIAAGTILGLSAVGFAVRRHGPRVAT
jgi:hypothetical protein